MGHQIEYFAPVPEPAIREWLDGLKGFYCSDPGEAPFTWEGELPSGGAFWAHMAPAACNFSLAMNYSGLFSGWLPAVEFAHRFEVAFWGRFGAVPLLRVDEYLVSEWSRAVGRAWWEVGRPVGALHAWLQSRDSHWHWLARSPENGKLDIKDA
jgi:hypothetical protein